MTDRLVILLILLCFSTSLFAKELSIPLNNALHGLAEYTEGDKDKPAVLIMHGILQTRNFSTTQKIGDFLEESGYTTLRPTISLGVDSRKESLACEAIHTHTMESDIEEIAQWVQWLKKRNHQSIILLGHSAGASLLVAYLDKYKNSQITPEKVILISLAYFGNRPSSNATSSEIDKARKAVAAGQLGPASFGFIYCNKYVSLPEAYLSYIEWSQKRITEALINIRSPVSLLFGAGDKRIDQAWPAKLSKMGMDVHITDEANHFFHGSHEFDLLDFIENAVDS
ncbi:MAG: DUF1749 domain-containing protein [gamma proteobacterium symbiont of Lucinoma myriamae]|nr:DUF1749 domain-containing protein [gamma proteobacterium symbiont of Lucinoma myriamae]MCU7818529.1 DUF1749 domain-containing protein [gamma proteobacterium symbiont of Lucinoma myriamae]MCU7833470.1 DUF1749 domain-containing protein [gamma proteobacterium symbiont of Lucinoma myriamae]